MTISNGFTVANDGTMWCQQCGRHLALASRGYRCPVCVDKANKHRQAELKQIGKKR